MCRSGGCGCREADAERRERERERREPREVSGMLMPSLFSRSLVSWEAEMGREREKESKTAKICMLSSAEFHFPEKRERERTKDGLQKCTERVGRQRLPSFLPRVSGLARALRLSPLASSLSPPPPLV